MTFFESGPDSSRGSMPDDPFARLHRSDRRRRRLVVWSAVLVLATVAVSAVVVVGPAEIVTSAGRVLTGEPPIPDAEVVAVADRSFLTDEGRRLLYSSRPLIADRAQIAEQCGRGDAGSSTLGCYHPLAGLVVYQPADPRIADAAVTTLTHELLHAAYEQLDDATRSALDGLLEAEIARVPADDPVHRQIALSVGDHESSRETELFAYLGSQVALDGGFSPDLEAIYSRWISDRPALVEVYRRVDSVIDGVLAEAQGAAAQLAVDDAANAGERAQLEVDRAAYDEARSRYNADADEYNALPPEERPQWIATWTTSEGESRSEPLGDSLASRLVELDRFRAELDSRTTALAAAEASVTQRRPLVDAQVADVSSLLESAYPGASVG